MFHHCDTRLSEVMCSLCLGYLLGSDLAFLYLFADACPLCYICQQGLLLTPTALVDLVRYIQFMLPKSPKSHHIAAASQHDPRAVPMSPSSFPRGANTCMSAVEWAVPLCADGSLFMSLVNYLQVLIITCRRYCVSVGITLRNLVLKLEKSSWWEKGQGSLLLGCVGLRALVGQQLKQARRVSAVSLHPQSHVFPLPKSLLTSLCCSQSPHPFHFPPSLAPQSPVPTPHLTACSKVLKWIPCHVLVSSVSNGNCRKHHQPGAFPAPQHSSSSSLSPRADAFYNAADNGCKTRPLQDVRGYWAEGEKTLPNHMVVSALVWCQAWLLVKLGSHFACLRLLKEKSLSWGHEMINFFHVYFCAFFLHVKHTT